MNLRFAFAVLPVALVLQGVGCGSSDNTPAPPDPAGTGGTGGAAAGGASAAGTGGTGGVSGSAGHAGGTAGSSGHGGAAGLGGGGADTGGHAGTSAGMSGAAGMGGAGASAGTAGNAGSAGTSGASGSAGQSGAAGSGGASGAAGSAGVAGSAGSGGSTTQGGSGGSAGTAGSDATGGSAGTGGSGGCVDGAPPDVTGSVFVSSHGQDINNGTPATPFGTIPYALKILAKMGGKTINLGPGTYDAPVVLPDIGVTIQGGWIVSGTFQWTRDCNGASPDPTIVTSTTAKAPVILADNLTLPVTLRSFTVQTKVGNDATATAPAESVFGLLARGSSTVVHLEGMFVNAQSAGSGIQGAFGANGKPVMCDGKNDCADGAMGQDGMDGTTANAGAFSDMGFTPGDGGDGTDGMPGHNGTKGGDGMMLECLTLCNANTAAACAMASPVATLQQSTGGTCGCAGVQGGGAKGGRGGGSTVAILISAGAQVVGGDTVSLNVSNGGDGERGGVPTTGGSGTVGQTGMAGPFCLGQDPGEKCQWMGNQCKPYSPSGGPMPAGTAGGVGGTGGKGGKGGGGAGGFSYAIVTIGSDSKWVAGTNSVINFGLPGKGADGAPDGAAAAIMAF